MARQQVYIAIYRLIHPQRLYFLQRFTVLKGDGCGNALNLHHINLAITFSHQLSCGIADTVDIDGEDGHCASRNLHLGQADIAQREFYTLLSREVLQTFVVINEDKAAAIR